MDIPANNNTPSSNVEAYCLLYQIENALRELIIERLEALIGPKWYKQRLPADVFEKYRSSRSYEQRTKWTQVVPHHPIYYVDFPDLRKTIEREDNWRDVFASVFVRKEVLTGTLAEIEAIRNSVAHNRVVGSAALLIVQGAHCKLSQAIGEPEFRQLATRSTNAPSIKESIALLRHEAAAAKQICSGYEELRELTQWRRIRRVWWFDDSYLGMSVDAIRAFFSAMEEYAVLPRGRGTGHQLEAWLTTRNVEELYISAQAEFEHILSV